MLSVRIDSLRVLRRGGGFQIDAAQRREAHQPRGDVGELLGEVFLVVTVQGAGVWR